MSREAVSLYRKSTGYQKVRLQCSICNTKTTVRTSYKEMYSKEVRGEWTCLLCDLKKERQNVK